MKKYLVNGEQFNTLSAYKEKDGVLCPVTSQNYDIREIEISESPAVIILRQKLTSKIEVLNT